MTATRKPSRIAGGWYRASDQLTLRLHRGDGFTRVEVNARIVPKRCRFRVPDVIGRDQWYTIESYAEQGHYTRENQR